MTALCGLWSQRLAAERWSTNLGGGVSMDDYYDDEDRGRRRHRARPRRPRRRRAKRRESEEEQALRDARLPEHERRYLEARRVAERKYRVVSGVTKHFFLGFILLILLPPVGVIILLIGLFKYGGRFYELVVEPKLRARFVDAEVSRQVTLSVTRERRELESEHSRSIEALSASIAHEIRNPITAAKSLVQQMGEDPAARDNVEYAEVALEELERVERSISHLLRFARDEEIRFSELRLAEVVDSALETFRDRLARSAVAVQREFDSDGVMEGDPEKLRRVMINLVGNALDALEESKTPEPRVDVALGENLAGSEVWVRVRDNGPGIDGEVQKKMFSPFFTSKANGTGLGLAITRKLVDAHCGAIEVTSSPGAGTEFVLSFPKQRPEQGVAS